MYKKRCFILLVILLLSLTACNPFREQPAGEVCEVWEVWQTDDLAIKYPSHWEEIYFSDSVLEYMNSDLRYILLSNKINEEEAYQIMQNELTDIYNEEIFTIINGTSSNLEDYKFNFKEYTAYKIELELDFSEEEEGFLSSYDKGLGILFYHNNTLIKTSIFGTEQKYHEKSLIFNEMLDSLEIY